MGDSDKEWQEPVRVEVSFDELFDELGLLPEVINVADLLKLNVAVAEMHLLLRYAADLRREGQESEAARTALRAAVTFISRFDTGVRENLLAPLMKITSALMALDEGTVDPLLRPKRKPKGGRTPDTWERQGLIGWAVGAAHRLQWTGLTPGQADREVAAALHQLGIHPNRGSGRLTGRTIREWRERVASDVGGHSATAKAANAMLTDGYKLRITAMPPREARKAVLKALQSYVLHERGELLLRKPANPRS